MNNLLQLKGKFEQASSNNGSGPPNLPSGKSVNVSKLEELLKNLVDLRDYWQKQDLLPGALISVYYNKVAAKSNRLKGLLCKGGHTSNKSIVGARFSSDSSPKHIITHYISNDLLNESISRLQACISILKQDFNGEISHQKITQINASKTLFTPSTIAKNQFFKSHR